jgi:uncharacterized protein
MGALDKTAVAGAAELEIVAYRREVAEIYREVRATADPAAAHARWRDRRNQLFASHPQSPLPAGDPLRSSGLPYWPYDPRWRFTVTLAAASAPARRALPTDHGQVTELRQLGWVDLPQPVGGRLAVWWLAQYGGGIFLPFRDATSGRDSYGAGRYLLDTAKGADLGTQDGRLVLDFNFAYHPSCRYDDAWQCPLAPPENRLAAAVTAGERLEDRLVAPPDAPA